MISVGAPSLTKNLNILYRLYWVSQKNTTLIEFQSILTRLKLNLFERFKNSFDELWDFDVVLGLRFFWDTLYF